MDVSWAVRHLARARGGKPSFLLVLGLECEGRNVETVEGMAGPQGLHPLQKAFADLGAAQCGYCTPGFLLTARALLEANPKPTLPQVREALAGNLCRCTGYVKIFEAVELAAAWMRARTPLRGTSALRLRLRRERAAAHNFPLPHGGRGR